jgi:hypothetical protein
MQRSWKEKTLEKMEIPEMKEIQGKSEIEILSFPLVKIHIIGLTFHDFLGFSRIPKKPCAYFASIGLNPRSCSFF